MQINKNAKISLNKLIKYKLQNNNINKPKKNFIIYLPLKALKLPNKELVKANDNFKKNNKEITKIRKIFSNLNFINNHTKSKFTNNKILIKSINKHNIKDAYDYYK